MTTKNTKATVATITNKSNTIRSKQRTVAKAASAAPKAKATPEPKAKASPEPTNFKRGDAVVTKDGVTAKVDQVKGDKLLLSPNDKRRRPFTVLALEVKPAKPGKNIEKVSKPSPRRGKPEAKNEAAAAQTMGEPAATKRVAARKAPKAATSSVKMTGQVDPALLEELAMLRKAAEYALDDAIASATAISRAIAKLEARFGIKAKKGKK